MLAAWYHLFICSLFLVKNRFFLAKKARSFDSFTSWTKTVWKLSEGLNLTLGVNFTHLPHLDDVAYPYAVGLLVEPDAVNFVGLETNKKTSSNSSFTRQKTLSPWSCRAWMAAAAGSRAPLWPAPPDCGRTSGWGWGIRTGGRTYARRRRGSPRSRASPTRSSSTCTGQPTM